MQAETSPPTWNTILQQAIQLKASDIHIEPAGLDWKVRLRIDGLLRDLPIASDMSRERISNFIKVMADLDISEKRLPQDGQIKTEVHGQTIQLRVSTMPVLHGEKIVMRIAGSYADFDIRLSTLGMNTQQENLLMHALQQSSGLILVTGPTGSGKSRTLYTCLKILNDGQKNICAIEDPIEIEYPGIAQIPIHTKPGFDYSHALRALLRQDPDVIMIGEIRDRVTAQIALEASRTGHLILASLHTSSALGSVARLSGLGIHQADLLEELRLVSAQRLVRKLCPNCQGSSNSCKTCHGKSYLGRIAVHEVLPMSPQLRQAFDRSDNVEAIKLCARSMGYRTLHEEAQRLIDQGLTDLKEVQRVLGSSCDLMTNLAES